MNYHKGLNWIIQYRCVDGLTDWSNMLGVDSESAADTYLKQLNKQVGCPWEYRVVEVKEID